MLSDGGLVRTLCPILGTSWSVAHQESSIHRIFQARIQEWVAISFSRGIFPTQGLNLNLLCWSSYTLATWCEELTHWERPWCWERLKTGGEGDERGWDGWMASPTRWTWVWASSGSWWQTREAWRAAVHGAAKSQTWLSDWTELNSCIAGRSFIVWATKDPKFNNVSLIRARQREIRHKRKGGEDGGRS